MANPKYSVSKTYNFCAAHRLEGHSKCSRMHGHNYEVQVTIYARVLIEGMVIDFTDLKRILGEVMDPMDHKYIVSKENQAKKCPYAEIAPSVDIFDLPAPASTAEYLAEHIATWVSRKMAWNVHSVMVSVKETPTSIATTVVPCNAFREEL